MTIRQLLIGGIFLVITFAGSSGFAQSLAVCEQNIPYKLEAPDDQVLNRPGFAGGYLV